MCKFFKKLFSQKDYSYIEEPNVVELQYDDVFNKTVDEISDKITKEIMKGIIEREKERERGKEL